MKFWKPGEKFPDQDVQSESQSEGSISGDYYTLLSKEKQQKRLPIYHYKNHILYLLENHQTLVIVGETGSGKSTQIPQYLVDSGWTQKGKTSIVITQPRRMAVISLARHVSEERNVTLGNEVGYNIRFDECYSTEETTIKYVTDGILLREMMTDPLLKSYSVIMLDEAHQRNINIDLCLGLLKKIQIKRPDLRIIISSATIDAELFKNFFSNAVILSVEGRNYPVDLFYTKNPIADYLKHTIDTILDIHYTQEPGDILAFVTSQDEVKTVVSSLIEELRTNQRKANYLRVLPLYSMLPVAEQMLVMQRAGKNTRKVVVATNVAETSITIEGIAFVVDCGFVKLTTFDPKTAVEALVVTETSQASSEQRAGRAGRCRNGKAYRLYMEEAFTTLPESTVPEIQRSNLMSVILQLKSLGVDNVLRFDFISPPPAECMVRGVEILYALGALDDNARLTSPLGRQMAEFPLQPMFIKMLLSARNYGCVKEALTIVAMLQVRNVFMLPHNQRAKAKIEHRKFAVSEGDQITLLNVFNSFLNEGNKTKRWCDKFYLNYLGLQHALKVRHHLVKHCSRLEIDTSLTTRDLTMIQKCIIEGFFMNAAKLHHDGSYHSLHSGTALVIHPSSCLATEKPPKWIIYNDVLQTSQLFIRQITTINPEWLYEIAPHFYSYGPDRSAKRAKYI